MIRCEIKNGGCSVEVKGGGDHIAAEFLSMIAAFYVHSKGHDYHNIIKNVLVTPGAIEELLESADDLVGSSLKMNPLALQALREIKKEDGELNG